MNPAHMRTIPNLAHLAFGTLILGGFLAAGLEWPMLR
jgi:hypothetical protein